VVSEATEVRQCLRQLEEKLGNGDDAEAIRKNFNELICLLDSPLLCQLLSIEDSLDALRGASHDRSLDEDDFDIDLSTGNLVLQPSDTKHRKSDSDSSACSESQGHIVNGHHRPAEDKHADELQVKQHVADVHADVSDVGFPPDLLRKVVPGSAMESITLDKPDVVGAGLGFGIVGLRSETAELGVYIQNIQPGGAADM